MKYIQFVFLFILALTASIESAEQRQAVVLAGVGRVVVEPFNEIYDIRSTVYVENAQEMVSLQGSYRHPYLTSEFQIEWHLGVDTQRSRIILTADMISFVIYLAQPIASNNLQEVFTVRPVFSSETGYPFKDSTFPPYCQWNLCQGAKANAEVLQMEAHTDPLWYMIDHGNDLFVITEKFPAEVDRILLSGINDAEVYPPRDLVFFEDSFFFPGGYVIGINALPLYKLSFIVQTVDGKRYEFPDVERKTDFPDTIRLVYSLTPVNDWQCY